MALPSKLKNFNVFQNGYNWMGQVPSITLPKLTRKTDKYRGAGMNAEVDLDFGMEGLELSFTAGGVLKEALRQWGALQVDAVLIRFAGAYQAEDTGAYTVVEVTGRGRYNEIDMGDAKAGDNTEHKYTMPLSYYKLEIDGVVVIEIDVINGIEIVNGFDNLGALRAALGLF